MSKSRRKIKQHEDLLTDPQFRHQVHKSKKQVMNRQSEQEWKHQLQDYLYEQKELKT